MPERTKAEVTQAINNAIADSQFAWIDFVNHNLSPAEIDPDCRPLAVKYTESKWAKSFIKQPNSGLFMGNEDYTWGRAVYVTGYREPLSTAIYGRVGLVSYFKPDPDWKVFDARDQSKADLYLHWLQLQKNYRKAITTVHTNHWLHGMRNDFREEFQIDVVLCNPDENDSRWRYTHISDTWMCVSDWDATVNHRTGKRKLASGHSTVFKDVRITVAPEEEFVAHPKPVQVRPPHNPPPRSAQLELSGKPPVLAPWDVANAYWNHCILRVKS
ncbi:hypothetical protein GCM10009641_18370 [Mycobacterium cookii]|uniref:Uncharacterized protein n=1 Tax=Mycobacterium cookii TaxID=1775 RepID=A0A7I7L0Z1_9MYCO|nr:hypothetical protein [Mycobacterium cookii]MCV7330179.1 hypothetical protein [Mycobacterium cookii]BBX47639.1 hypothetical protein MCOO_36540 [Mycobacterium cookii]